MLAEAACAAALANYYVLWPAQTNNTTRHVAAAVCAGMVCVMLAATAAAPVGSSPSTTPGDLALLLGLLLQLLLPLHSLGADYRYGRVCAGAWPHLCQSCVYGSLIDMRSESRRTVTSAHDVRKPAL